MTGKTKTTRWRVQKVFNALMRDVWCAVGPFRDTEAEARLDAEHGSRGATPVSAEPTPDQIERFRSVVARQCAGDAGEAFATNLLRAAVEILGFDADEKRTKALLEEKDAEIERLRGELEAAEQRVLVQSESHSLRLPTVEWLAGKIHGAVLDGTVRSGSLSGLVAHVALTAIRDFNATPAIPDPLPTSLPAGTRFRWGDRVLEFSCQGWLLKPWKSLPDRYGAYADGCSFTIHPADILDWPAPKLTAEEALTETLRIMGGNSNFEEKLKGIDHVLKMCEVKP